MIVSVRPDGGCAVYLFSLWPPPLFPVAYHPVVLHHGIVFFDKAFPVLMEAPIHYLRLREGRINGIKQDKCSKSSIDMRIVKMFVILHVSRALESIYILVHTRIDSSQQTKFITPFSHCSGFSIML